MFSNIRVTADLRIVAELTNKIENVLFMVSTTNEHIDFTMMIWKRQSHPYVESAIY